LKDSEKEIKKAYNDLSRLEKEIEKEHDLVFAIISNFGDPIIFVDKEGKVNLLNPAALKILKIKKDMVGRKIAKKNNYSMDNFRKIVSRSFKIKLHKSSEVKNNDEEELSLKYNSQDLIYKVITSKVVDGRKYLGTMKIFYNLTREKEIDKLKSEFISIAAHQLRTPLSAIKWSIKIVLDGDAGKISEEQKEFLFKGYKSNERIISLVDDMLNVSRIEEGRVGYTFKKDSLEEPLNIVIESLKNQKNK